MGAVSCLEGDKGGQCPLVLAVSQVTLIQIINMPMRHIWERYILLPYRFIIYYCIPATEIPSWTWSLLFSLLPQLQVALCRTGCTILRFPLVFTVQLFVLLQLFFMAASLRPTFVLDCWSALYAESPLYNV